MSLFTFTKDKATAIICVPKITHFFRTFSLHLTKYLWYYNTVLLKLMAALLYCLKQQLTLNLSQSQSTMKTRYLTPAFPVNGFTFRIQSPDTECTIQPLCLCI